MTSKFYAHRKAFGDDTLFVERLPDNRYVVHRPGGRTMTTHPGAFDLVVADRVWVEIEDPRKPAPQPDRVLAPRQATSRMLWAGHRAGGDTVSCGRIWTAMIEQWERDNG